MKKKVLSAISLSLVCTMMAASLTGCGTKAEATDNIIVGEENLDSEETIVVNDGQNNVTDEEASEDNTVNAADEITKTEEEVVDVTATDGDIVLYDEIGEYPDYLIGDFTFEPMEKKQVDAVDDIPIYSEEGIKVGHVKGGVTIVLTEHGINSRWYRFENPVNGTDYDYLYVIEDDFPIDESELLTSDEVKEWIIEDLNNYSFVIPVFLDEPDSDMEYVEFSIDRQGNRGDAGLKINQVLFPMESDVISSDYGDYSTYYVECTENDMNVDCRVYYKDFVDPKDFYDKSK